MCLLVFLTATGKMSTEHVREAWRCNPHGAGMAWVENNQVMIQKGFMKLEDLESNLKLIAGRPSILHFRIASVGTKTADNCHPFDAGGEWAMGHNGTIPNMKTVGEESDTAAFARDVLQPILDADAGAIFDYKLQKELEAKIPGSKMVLLNPKGQRVILNEQLGHWVEGVWYSNNSYKIPARSTFTTYCDPKWDEYKKFYHAMLQDEWSKPEQKKSKAQRRAEKKARRLLGKGSTGHNSGSSGKGTTGDKFPGLPPGDSLVDYECIGGVWQKVEETPMGQVGSWLSQRKRNRETRSLFRGHRFTECNSSGNCEDCGEEFPNDGEAFLDSHEHVVLCRSCSLKVIEDEQEDVNDQREGSLYEQEQIELERAEQDRLMGVNAF